MVNSWGRTRTFRRRSPRIRYPDLVGPQHGLKHQDVVADAQHAEAGALAHGELDDGRPVGLGEGLAQQDIGLGGVVVGSR